MEDWFAHWFDADYLSLYAHRDEAEAAQAVRTALAFVPELGRGPVLDLACGTGRHLLELRWHNPGAFGLDLSPELLGRAAPELRGSLLRADMRRLPLRPESLTGITMWFTPFGYFSAAENKRLLASLAACLRPGGVLLLDYLNAERVRTGLVPKDRFEREGLRVTSRRSLEGGRLVKRILMERTDTGARREVVESVQLYEPEEIEALLAEAGLGVFARLGDYAGAPFDALHSPRWLALARKA